MAKSAIGNHRKVTFLELINNFTPNTLAIFVEYCQRCVSVWEIFWSMCCKESRTATSHRGTKQCGLNFFFNILCKFRLICETVGRIVVLWNSVSDKKDEKKNRMLLISGSHLYNFGLMPNQLPKAFTKSIHVKRVSMARKLYQKNLNSSKIN